MGADIATQAFPVDAKTGLILPLSKSLDSRALAKHRATIALELEVMAKKFDRFGWERDRNSPAHDRLLTDWMDALQDYPLDEVKAACRAAVTDSPNRMPNEGHVIAAIKEARRRAIQGRSRLARAPEPERKPVSKEEAAAILAKAGFGEVRRVE